MKTTFRQLLISTAIVSGLLNALLAFSTVCMAQDTATQTVYLSGKGTDDAVPWKFQVTGGQKANQPSIIPVPSCWELQGFGTYSYGRDPAQQQPNEQGLYERSFDVPADWAQRRVFLVFEGVMTDAEAKVNGKSAGPRHQGAFYPFQYEVTDLLKYGSSNLLEVTVYKESSDASVNRAERRGDYWNYAGIFRPVYLQAHPKQFIERTAVNARADGQFEMSVYINGAGAADAVSGEIAGTTFQEKITIGQDQAVLKTRISNPRTWTAETPNLYTVHVSLKRGDKVVHEVDQRFGFRTIEVRPGDGVYLNGGKIRFRGVDRHVFDPDTGRATSRALSLKDVQLIKEMNMNAVRMSHYPPDMHFLEVCDEQGLYILDELAGWQARYDTEIGGKLLEAMVKRDLNHPCILFWDNGNEGGWNTQLDNLFAKFDPQQRLVLHPQATFGPVNNAHYPTYSRVGQILSGNTVFFSTEFMHGLYDGGMGAGLADYWELMLSKPLSAGGFLWVLTDEAVKRTDQNDRLDGKGNQAPDGILGPHREKEGSFYAVKEIWSPVRITLKTLPGEFDGSIPVENVYDFTNLSQCKFTWQLVDFRAPDDAKGGHTVVDEGSAPAPAVAPHEKGTIRLPLPATWKQRDALYLTAVDPAGKQLYTWTWPIAKAVDLSKRIVGTAPTPVSAVEEGDAIKVAAGNVALAFSKTDGRLNTVTVGGKPFSFSGGPTLLASNAAAGGRGGGSAAPPTANVAAPKPLKVTHKADGNEQVVRAEYEGAMKYAEWRVNGAGWVKLDYAYELTGQFDYFGVGFQFPEKMVKSVKWLGGGPYRVWKNRLAGATLDVWEKPYNDAVTGEVWQYPEFKGYHAGVRWAVLQTAEGPLTLVAAQDDLFLQLFVPRNPSQPMSERMAFPQTDIGLLHAIVPIGNKFQSPGLDSIGPSSQKNTASGTYQGVVYFRFGE
jgi:hypothetical protein